MNLISVLLRVFILMALWGPLNFRIFAQTDSVPERRIDLSGQWKFQREPGHKSGEKGNGASGKQAITFNDSPWETIRVGASWESQGHAYNGVAWYRKSFVIPAEWQGASVVFSAGNPDDGGEVYFNGVSLGTFTFKEKIECVLPDAQIKWGEENLIAVRVWDWYKNGGLSAGGYAVERVAPFSPEQDEGESVVSLGMTADLVEGVLEPGRWERGLQLIGVDERSQIDLAVTSLAFEGKDGVEFTVTNPNTRQYIDYLLPPGKKGADWARQNFDYISFWVKSSDLTGDIAIRLNKGRLVAGKKSQSASTYVSVTPGDWKKVILPFSQFLNEYASNYDRVIDQREPVFDPSFVDSIGLGYENNRLQGAGRLQVANFEVGRFSKKGIVKGIPLNGLWKFKRDNIRPDGEKSVFGKMQDAEAHLTDRMGYGEMLGYARPSLDDREWEVVRVPGRWREMGLGYKGPAWYRQQVLIPENWQGKTLELYLGQPEMFGELYWNGERVGQVDEESGGGFFARIPADKVNVAGLNDLAVRVVSWRPRRAGIQPGRMEILPEQSSVLQLSDVQTPNVFVAPEQFEMGSKPGKQVRMRFKFVATETAAGTLQGRFRLRDCYFRTISEQTFPLTLNDQQEWVGTVTLSEGESRQLYYSEFFETTLLLEDVAGEPVDALYLPVSKLKYAERDERQLPALAETIEETPFGKLRLVDVIDCAADPSSDIHPYKEGGIRASWVGTQAYSSWINGVRVESYDGREYREASNNQYFGYRIGRGKLKPHTAYLVRILVPEDKIRYANIEMKAGRNFQGVGYRNGISSDHPHFSYPLSGGYSWVDSIVMLDDTTYGYLGSRSVDAEKGFWIFFHDIGRVYAGAYEEGPAAAEIRLYEILNPEEHYPVIRYPEGEKKRIFMTDWERQPEQPPEDVATWARLVGLNVVSPVIQKWAFHGFWHSRLGFAPPGWYKASPEGEDDRDIYKKWLDGTREVGIGFIPRVEYGGSTLLPDEAKVINNKGKIDPCGRFCPWGANILNEATWAEFEVLIDELIGQYYQDYPQLMGLHWRQRNERIKCSYGPADVALFCEDMGYEMPEGNDKQIAQWASGKMKNEYNDWWQKKRRDFLVRALQHLQRYNPDFPLLYNNWDEDGWARFGALRGTPNKGMPHAAQTPEEWGKFYNLRASRSFQLNKFPPQNSDEVFIDLLRNEGAPHHRIYPDLFADVEGVHLFAPVSREDLANSEAYQRYFQTGSGYAMSFLFDYEERARWNVQGDTHEASMIGPGGANYAMAYEVLACFYGDPNVITFTTYTMGRTFVSEMRRFAQAYLALPDKTGLILEEACRHPDVRVRSYMSAGTRYIGVVYKGIQPETIEVRVPANGARELWDQVSGTQVNIERDGDDFVWEIAVSPMSLHSYHLK
ncbi:hypothetical protein P3T73_14430 [Kiritimatiellota bacterium B12222]|nr:hypothetical protein P3T73_14430 [Kiritimatiellota bacterium B12222]